MKTLKLIIIATMLLLASPVFANDEPSLAQLQQKSLAAKQQEQVNDAAQLRYLKSLYRHAMQVFARGVQSLIKSGVKLKTTSQAEEELEKDAGDPGSVQFRQVPTDYSPYISEEYMVGGGLTSDEGANFELVGGETVSMSLPFGPHISDISDIDQSELSKLVSDSGRPIDSCKIKISFANGTGNTDDGDTPELSCTPFLQGKYDAEIITLITKLTREAIIDNQQ